MEEIFLDWLRVMPLAAIFGIIAASLYVLSRGADLLVDEAVALSIRAGISKVIIGATIISIGTTLPEASVSVMSAISGDPELALGNAVGSIICDTGLILGLAALIGPIPLEPRIANRQGWIQLGSGLLLVLCSIPYSQPMSVFSAGGNLPRYAGIMFVLLLLLYLWVSIRWAKNTSESARHDETSSGECISILLKIALGIALVLISSKILIPTVQETALRLSVPRGIIAATLVAFGTSLPEFVTAITAVRKGYGEIALGNIIGADILNVLFVAGLSAAVTPGGLAASGEFFRLLFPAMLAILAVFRIGIALSDKTLTRPFGALLLVIYLATTVLSYVII
ncbi:MAG TPA: sodium:calcium antiporter [Desulfobacteraceae bacterium]|nr:sodium:calcium antiporter [Desulfobacteraceae bacterium]